MWTWMRVQARDRIGSGEGAVALEYAALVVGIIVLLLGGVYLFGADLAAFFGDLFPGVIAS